VGALGQSGLWVVMPAYNEAECIRAVTTSWLSALDELAPRDSTLLVVDDGSTDDTPRILEEVASRDGRLRVAHQENAGHGAALLLAYRHAVGAGARWVFQTDSDGQMSPDDLERFWANRDFEGLTLGYRANRQDTSSRRLISGALRLALQGALGVRLRDANVPYRLFHGPYLSALLARLPRTVATPNIALSVLAARDGRLVEMPAGHSPRAGGRSVLRRGRLVRLCLRSLREILALRRDLSERSTTGSEGRTP